MSGHEEACGSLSRCRRHRMWRPRPLLQSPCPARGGRPRESASLRRHRRFPAIGGTQRASQPRCCARLLPRFGRSDFHFNRGPGRQSRAVEGVTDRRQLDRVGHVVVDRHLQQFARHPVGGFLDALPRFALQRRSGWALRPHRSIGPNLDRSVIVVSFLANPPCGEQSRCADHDVGLFGAGVGWGGMRPRLSTTSVSISTPPPLQGEGEVETRIRVELLCTPADASSCLRPDHGDTPIMSQRPQNSHAPH
jgi:hypothetical protein